MKTRGEPSGASGQKKKRDPSSDVNASDHFPGDGNVIKPENTAPTLVVRELLANAETQFVERGNVIFGTVVLVLGRWSNSGICQGAI